MAVKKRRRIKKRSSAGKKLATGCALGCGVIVLGIAGLAGFVWHVSSPADQSATIDAVTASSRGAFYAGNLGADDGTTAMLQHTVFELQRIGASQESAEIPDFLKQLQQAQSQLQQVQEQFQMFLPTEAALSIEPVEGRGEPGFVAALNLPRLGNLLAWGMSWAMRSGLDYEKIEHDGETIQSSGKIALCRCDGTLLLSDDPELIKRHLDGGSGGGAAGAPRGAALVRPTLETMGQAEWDVTGALTTESPWLRKAISHIAADEEVEAQLLLDIVIARIGINAVSADEMNLRVAVEGADEEAGKRLFDRLFQLADVFSQRSVDTGLEVDTEASAVEQNGKEVVATLRLTGMKPWISRALEEKLTGASES